MVEVRYNYKETKEFRNMRNPLMVLDIDCRVALDSIAQFHPNILPVANRLCSMVGHFIIKENGQPFISDLLREAVDEFENTYDSCGLRIAYYNFFNTVAGELPKLLNYVVEIKASGKPSRFVDFLKDDIKDCISSKGDILIISYNPITPSLTNHELSLLFMSRVFTRTDLLNIGVPSIGYNSVVNLLNYQVEGDICPR